MQQSHLPVALTGGIQGCALEDLIGPTQFPVLPLELGDTSALVGAHAGSRLRIDFLLHDPAAQRLPPKPQLFGNGRQAALGHASGFTPLTHQPHCPFPELVRVHPRSSHRLHPSCTEWSLSGSRGGSPDPRAATHALPRAAITRIARAVGTDAAMARHASLHRGPQGMTGCRGRQGRHGRRHHGTPLTFPRTR